MKEARMISGFSTPFPSSLFAYKSTVQEHSRYSVEYMLYLLIRGKTGNRLDKSCEYAHLVNSLHTQVNSLHECSTAGPTFMG